MLSIKLYVINIVHCKAIFKDNQKLKIFLSVTCKNYIWYSKKNVLNLITYDYGISFKT